MPKEPKAALSLTPEASACAKDHLENTKRKSQEAYQGFTPLGPSWPDYLCLFDCYLGRNFVLRLLMPRLLLGALDIVK